MPLEIVWRKKASSESGNKLLINLILGFVVFVLLNFVLLTVLFFVVNVVNVCENQHFYFFFL